MIISALRQTWDSWAELGSGLHAEQWTRTTRLDGWNVKDVYAHCCWAPPVLRRSRAGRARTDRSGHPRTCSRDPRGDAGFGRHRAHLRRRHTPARDRRCRQALDHRAHRAVPHRGPRVLQQLEALDPTRGVDYGGTAVLPLGAALRITLLEAVVHYLDIAAALDFPRPGPVSGSPLAQTVELLAEIADPVAFVDHATGRSTARVFPVLR